MIVKNCEKKSGDVFILSYSKMSVLLSYYHWKLANLPLEGKQRLTTKDSPKVKFTLHFIRYFLIVIFTMPIRFS